MCLQRFDTISHLSELQSRQKTGYEVEQVDPGTHLEKIRCRKLIHLSTRNYSNNIRCLSVEHQSWRHLMAQNKHEGLQRKEKVDALRNLHWLNSLKNLLRKSKNHNNSFNFAGFYRLIVILCCLDRP